MKSGNLSPAVGAFRFTMRIMIMKRIDLFKRLLKKNIEAYGEDAPSVKGLKRQIASLEYMEETGSKSAQETFLTMKR